MASRRKDSGKSGGTSSLRVFIRSIERDRASGSATEHTYRPALKALLETIGTGITATNEPKRVECGAPDFVVTKRLEGADFTLGHLEAKDPDTSLDQIEKDAGRAKPRTIEGRQLQRYLAALPNLVFTNHLEFRWYVEGRRRANVRLASTDGPAKLHIEDESATHELLDEFLRREPQPIATPRELAERMAQLTHLIRDVIVKSFETGKASENMRGWKDAFQEVLVPGLEVQDFADMFSQTLAYGLFAARCNHPGPAPFKRVNAAAEIPKTNPFLRRLFDLVTGVSLEEEPFAGFVDDLAQTFALTDMTSVLHDFGRRGARQDPVVHFYETFLAAYDPELRDRRGVYYTPEPVVSFIVRSVDWVLKEQFGCASGLADTQFISITRTDETGAKVQRRVPRVLLLDPACGTGTFLYSVVDSIRAQFVAKARAGQWSSYVHDHILPRVFGFELLMAPYAVAHFKLGMQLAGLDLDETMRARWAYDFGADERLGVYLTNTLEEAEKRSRVLFAQFVADEANAAAAVKSDLPIMVVMGNPPYSGHSANKSDWIRGLVEDYVINIPKEEQPRQKKWLQDDYVKFIRFGQWRIERTGQGILAFITNHSYLDSPTFKGMRRSLMDCFDEVYVLDLHGNAKKGEHCPDGSKDENVFDIQQGVAIAIFIRRSQRSDTCSVRHAELWGLREAKYERLLLLHSGTVQWADLQPHEPDYLFVPVPQDDDLEIEFKSGVLIPGLMNQNGTPAPGVLTTQDKFAISWTTEDAIAKVDRLLATKSESDARSQFKLCSQDQWNYLRAKKELANTSWRERVVPIFYRPFDLRYTVYDPNVAVHRRERVTSHMLQGDNLALLTTGLTKGESFAHAMVTRHISEVICLSPKTSNNAFIFPLYLRVEGELNFGASRRPNLDPRVVSEIGKQLGLTFTEAGAGDLETTFGPEDVFHYVYAVLHSPTYRKRYEEYLRRGFPRIQFTDDTDLFAELCAKGASLVDLHLLDADMAKRCDNPLESLVAFPERGDNLVEPGQPKYMGPAELDPIRDAPISQGRVYISQPDKKAAEAGQYFEGILPEAWQFMVGGYQVCEKWLKDRRGRNLTSEEVVHYQKIVVAVTQTIRLMKQTDEVIEAHGGWPGAFHSKNATTERLSEARLKVAERGGKYGKRKGAG